MIIDRFLPIARRMPARSWPRAVAKTLTWRLFATLDTFLIGVLVTKNLKLAGSIVGIEVMTKMVWYLLHERAWARVSPATDAEARPATAPTPTPPHAAPEAAGRRWLAVPAHPASRPGGHGQNPSDAATPRARRGSRS